jgi:hypothetical protein
MIVCSRADGIITPPVTLLSTQSAMKQSDCCAFAGAVPTMLFVVAMYTQRVGASHATTQHCEYLVEEDTDFVGDNIGTCGAIKVMTSLRDTCTINSQCVGFTTKLTDDGDWEGWCAKGTMRTKTSALDHNAYTKYCSTDNPPTSGKCTRCLIH